MARAGRRRRVLNEEVRAAGCASTAMAQPDEPSTDTPRYGEQASIEHHPQVTDFVPRRFGKVVMVVLAGLAIAGMAESMDRYAGQMGTLLPAVSKAEVAHFLSPGLSHGLLAWSSAMVLLAIGVYARLIFMLRRHRVDDYRGRYRIWRKISWLAVLLSLNSVLALHEPLARILGEVTGWQLMAGQSGWWLGLTMLICGPLLLRLTFEVAESRAALTVTLMAIVCYSVAGVAVATNWSPEWLGAWSGLLVHALPFQGHVLMLTAVLLNARYVVLDAQGLLQHQPKQRAGAIHLQAETMEPQALADSGSTVEPSAKKVASKPAARPVLAVASETIPDEKTPDDESRWVNGTEQEQDSDQKQRRRLSKSERKRIRKQKTRRAA